MRQRGHDNRPIELWSNKVIDEKINYIHNNPVDESLIYNSWEYIYSSAKDYSGGKGILDDIIFCK